MIVIIELMIIFPNTNVNIFLFTTSSINYQNEILSILPETREIRETQRIKQLLLYSKKFYIRSCNNKVDSNETGNIVIKKIACTYFQLLMINFIATAKDFKGRTMEIAANSSVLTQLCYKEFEKFLLCKSVSQSEATFIVYSEPIEIRYKKLIFHNGSTFKM